MRVFPICMLTAIHWACNGCPNSALCVQAVLEKAADAPPKKKSKKKTAAA